MEYLVCNHCNHPNELKSPYLTFCNSCHKKLENNFNDWSKEHPDKSWSEYKTSVSQTILNWEVEPETSGKETQKQSRVFMLTTAAVILLIIIFLGVQLVRDTSDDLKQWAAKNMQFGNVTEADWETLVVPQGNFEIKFPGVPKESLIKNDQNTHVPVQHCYSYIPEKGEDINLEYSLAYMSYPSDLINSSLITATQVDNFFQHTIRGLMEEEQGVLKSNKDIVYGLYPGKEILAGTNQGLVEMKCRLFLVENTLYLLKVSSNYQSSGNKASDVFLNSFKLLSYAQVSGF